MMKEQLPLLVALQEKDSQRFALQKQIDAEPVRIAQIDAMVKEKEAKLKASEEEVKALQVKRKEREGDIKTKEELIKKHQGQLFQVKTNKEYSALEQEINGIKADISAIEDEVISLLDEIDRKGKENVEEKKVVEEEKKKLAAQRAEVERDIKQLKTQLDGLTKEREEILPKVDQKLLAQYEKLLTNKEGIAIAPIEHDSCSGCYMKLPPQVINEVKMQKEPIYCGNCLRILYCPE